MLTEVLARAKVLGYDQPTRATMIVDRSTLFAAHYSRTNLTNARTIGLRIHDMDGPAAKSYSFGAIQKHVPLVSAYDAEQLSETLTSKAISC
jgi:hypothetical protein